MATPRTTIDALPEQGTMEDTNLLIVQDDGITKKMSVATLRAQGSIPFTAHLADATDAHAASAISAGPSGTGVDSATVQGQLSQLAALVDGAATIAETDAKYVELTGDTMTGPLTLPGDPTAPLHAATMQFVNDAVADATGGGLTEAAADLLYVNVGGDTMTGPLVLAADPGDLLEAVTKQYADALVAAAALDPRYVRKSGDTMTGPLAVMVAQIGTRVDVPGHARFGRADQPGNVGLIVTDTGLTGIGASGGQHNWYLKDPTATATAGPYNLIATMNETGLVVAAARKLVFTSALRQMVDLYGTTYGIGVQSGNAYLRTGGGFRIYRGGVHSDTAGAPGTGGVELLSIGDPADTAVLNGQLSVSYSGGAGVQPIVLRSSGAGPYVSFFHTDGTRKGYCGGMGTGTNYDMILACDQSAGDLTLQAGGTGAMLLRTGSTEQARVDVNGMLVGKTVTTLDTVSGHVFLGGGSRYATKNLGDAGYVDYICRRAGTIGSNDGFTAFYTNATIIGRIVAATATTIAYQTSSAGELKGNITDVDDDDAVERVMAWRPVDYQWRHVDGDPTQPAHADGIPAGRVERGFIAEEMALIEPTAAMASVGTQAEHDAWVELREQIGLEAGEDPYTPGGGDWSKLVPTLAAAFQALVRRVATLEAQLA